MVNVPFFYVMVNVPVSGNNGDHRTKQNISLL